MDSEVVKMNRVSNDELVELIQKCNDGDQRAWYRLTDHLRRYLQWVNWSRPADSHEWREERFPLMEEAMWEAVKGYKEEKGPFLRYLNPFLRGIVSCVTRIDYEERIASPGTRNTRLRINNFRKRFEKIHLRQPSNEEVIAGLRATIPTIAGILHSPHIAGTKSISEPIGDESDEVSEIGDFIPDVPDDENAVERVQVVILALLLWHKSCILELKQNAPDLVPIFAERYGKYWRPTDSEDMDILTTGWPESLEELLKRLPPYNEKKLPNDYRPHCLAMEQQMLKHLLAAGLLRSVPDW